MVPCFRHRNAFLFVITISFIILSLSIGQYYYSLGEHYHYVYVNTSKFIAHTDKEFLSVALDTSFMAHSFHTLNKSDWKRLENLTSILAPAYLRLGGTDADRVFFTRDSNIVRNFSLPKIHFCDGDFNECQDVISPADYLIITSKDWLQFNKFVQKTKSKLIFDLNVLLRNENNTWNSSNAELLINFSERHKFFMDFQLGNEPNSFQHVFNLSISGDQLAEDFKSLRKILNGTKLYRNSKLIGPDVTRPKKLRRLSFQENSLKYLNDFLSEEINVNVVSWHQYYLNGRLATPHNFTDPVVLDVLSSQIFAIKKTVEQYSTNLPIWLSETSSAYGGGAPGLSDKYLASFMWLDKLGLAASMGIKVVTRQTLFGGNYALINSILQPLPDYWISVAYKKFVGNQVLNTELGSLIKKDKKLRFYSHCAKKVEKINATLVIFGMNLGSVLEYIVPSNFKFQYPIYSYTFTTENNNLLSESVLLNGKKLKYEDCLPEAFSEPKLVKLPLVVPPYAIVFWLFNEIGSNACQFD